MILSTGPCPLRLSWQFGYTNHLRGYKIQISLEPFPLVSVDLTPNLVPKRTPGPEFRDALHLARGDIDIIMMFQIRDDSVRRKILALVKEHSIGPDNWILNITLKGTHSYSVLPSFKSGYVDLEILKPLKGGL